MQEVQESEDCWQLAGFWAFWGVKDVFWCS
jgi:hypothetical protein